MLIFAVNSEGIITAVIFFLSNVSFASAKTKAESMPPDKPINSFLKLFLTT